MSLAQSQLSLLMKALVIQANSMVQSKLEAIRVPHLNNRTRINGTIVAAGGTLNLLAGLTNRERKILGLYVEQTGGAARNFMLEITDGVNTERISQNNTGPYDSQGTIWIIEPDDTLRINAVAAADIGTWEGQIAHTDIGLPARS